MAPSSVRGAVTRAIRKQGFKVQVVDDYSAYDTSGTGDYQSSFYIRGTTTAVINRSGDFSRFWRGVIGSVEEGTAFFWPVPENEMGEPEIREPSDAGVDVPEEEELSGGQDPSEDIYSTSYLRDIENDELYLISNRVTQPSGVRRFQCSLVDPGQIDIETRPEPIPGVPYIIDGFEDGDIFEYSGDTGPYQANDTNPHDNVRSLECTTTSAGAKRIFRTDIEWSAGDSRELHVWVDREHSASLLFGTASRGGGYAAQLRDSGESDVILQLGRYEDGFNSVELSVLGIDRSDYDWLDVGVDWRSDGTITLSVADESGQVLGGVQGEDTTYDTGGVGVGCYTDETDETTTFFDTIRAVEP